MMKKNNNKKKKIEEVKGEWDTRVNKLAAEMGAILTEMTKAINEMDAQW